MKTLTGFLLCLWVSLGWAGTFPPDSFRTSSNPWYWKNRKPYPDYWQQDVYYRIKASLDPFSREVKGNLILTYYNNSPDTLKEFTFHLYQNAFQPESYLDQMRKGFNETPEYGELEAQKKGTQVHAIRSPGRLLETLEDNTIFRVFADKALLPNDSMVFEIAFSSWFDTGPDRRRMKMFPVEQEGGNQTWHFDGVHWYPRISVYDRRMTWDVQQHFGKEFYGDFGTWDVELTLPSEYIVEATGEILNEAEVLPPTLRQALDIRNFKDKKIGTPASIIIPADGTTKTWKYHAVNVHDFAFTADPTYRIDEVKAGRVRCIAVAQEQNAAKWQDAAGIAAKVIQLYSDYLFPYAYPKMVVADAQDGMEYPMLTLDGGHSPGYTALLAHEIGHNWFFGMLGTNETYRAFMDEGFTQFLTMFAMDSLKGWDKEGISKDRLQQGYFRFMAEAIRDHEGHLNTHADEYYASCGHGGQYSMAYHKTAVMLYNLQYYLGKEVFQAAMQQYFHRWAMAHPYPEDFRLAITDYARTDLSRFFDDWMESEKKVDYGIRCIRRAGRDSVRLTFTRTGDLVMPLAFSLTSNGHGRQNYLIPSSYFNRVEKDEIRLPYWYQFGELGRTYEVTLPAGKRPVVNLDPSRRLGDIRMMDNQTGLFPTSFNLALTDHHQGRSDWEKYTMHVRPWVWWNRVSGIQAGGQFQGHYMNTRHRVKAGLVQNTGIFDQYTGASMLGLNSRYYFLNYWASYQTQFSPLGKDGDILLESAYRDGAFRNVAGLEKWYVSGPSYNSAKQGWYAQWVYLFRPQSFLTNYLVEEDTWRAGFANSYFKAGWRRQYKVPYGTGRWKLEARSTAPGSDSDYRNLRFESVYNWQILNKTFTLKYRFYAQIGEGNTPIESQTMLSGGNAEEAWSNDFYRAEAFFPERLTETEMGRRPSNVHFGGGYNLRGYSGYRAEFEDGGAAWYGNNGTSVNLELEFDDRIPFRPPFLKDHVKLDAYLFADAGILGRNLSRRGFDKPEWDKLRADFGVGTAFNLYRTRKKQTQPLIIRADFPFLLTTAPFIQDNFQFRWMVGVGRAF